MPLNDPPRLLDPSTKTSSYLRDALDAGRADVPRTDQLARLAQRLPIGPLPPPPPAPAIPSPAPLAAIPSALPGAIVGAVLGLMVVGFHAIVTPADAPSGAESRAPIATLVAAPTRPAAPTPARRDETGTLPTAVVRPIAAPAITAAPSAGSVARSAEEAPGEEPKSSTVTEGFAPYPAVGDLSAAAPAVDSETEIQLLQRAQDALGRSPATALDLVTRHAARFPGAALGQEREVLAIDALVRLGRTGEARARAAAFAARFPTSAHLRRIEALVPNSRIDR